MALYLPLLAMILFRERLFPAADIRVRGREAQPVAGGGGEGDRGHRDRHSAPTRDLGVDSPRASGSHRRRARTEGQRGRRRAERPPQGEAFGRNQYDVALTVLPGGPAVPRFLTARGGGSEPRRGARGA